MEQDWPEINVEQNFPSELGKLLEQESSEPLRSAPSLLDLGAWSSAWPLESPSQHCPHLS